MMLVRGGFERTRNHWWWRPGWGPGTRYVTFHLTFEQAPSLSAEAARIGHLLSRVPGVDVVPPEWLHLTMTGVGLADDLDSGALDRIAHAVFARVTSLTTGPLSLSWLYLHREGLSLAAEPTPWLSELKRAQEAAVAAETGASQTGGDAFHPHVSLAYFTGEIDESALRRAVDDASPTWIVVEEPMVSMIELNRDRQVYTWRVLAQLPLGSSSQDSRR